jgi:hypothetical protein
VTSFVDAASSSPSASSTAVSVPSHKSFMQDTPVAATVLTIVGLITLCIAASILAFVIRKVKQRKLHDEAIVWPDVNNGGSRSPTRMSAGDSSVGAGRDAYYQQDAAEKARYSAEKYGSEESAATGYGPGSTMVDHGVPSKMDYYKQGYPAPPATPGYAQPPPPQQQQQGFYSPGYGPQWNQAPMPQYQNQYQNYAPPVPMKSPPPPQNAYPQPPQRALLPQLNVITAMPSPSSMLADGNSPQALALPPSPSPQQSLDSTAAGGSPPRTSLINANPGNTSPVEREPPSPGGRVGRRQSAHARELDPTMPALPMPAPLPDAFGKDDFAVRLSDESARDKTLKVANE